MGDNVGCDVCGGCSSDGYSLERFGNGWRCQSHIPRQAQVVEPTNEDEAQAA